MVKITSRNISGIKLERALLEKLKKTIRTAVAAEYPQRELEISILFCGDDEIKRLNREYRGIDKATDVLSFPLLDEEDDGVSPAVLGDIAISVPRAQLQAEEYGHSFEREICFLAAHSALHLIGYDHENDEEMEIMEARQREILDSLAIYR